MTMFVNLHQLPAGQDMFTVAIASVDDKPTDPYYCIEEIDLVCPSGSSLEDVLAAAKGPVALDYGLDAVVAVGVINRSSDWVMWEDHNNPRRFA